MSDAVAGSLQMVGSRAADTILVPESVEELTEIVRDAGMMTLVPAAGRTKLGLGNDVVGPFGLLDLTHVLPGSIEHEPADMTAIVDATVTVGQVQAHLAAHRQRLPLDPALPDQATIGGMLATGLAGPLQTRFGLPRDHALGMTVVRPDGVTVKAGGRVVKNVTGYDLVRMWCGSLGTLGVITSASLRVVPLAETSEMAWNVIDAAAACAMARNLLQADFRPEVLEAIGLIGGGWTLFARLPVQAAEPARRLFPGIVDCPEGVYEMCRDMGFRDEDALAVRLVTLPTALPAMASEIAQLQPSSVTLRPTTGSLRATWTSSQAPAVHEIAAQLDSLRAKVREVGGSVTVEAMPDTFRPTIDAWGMPASAMGIMQRLKRAYDPDARLNRGRFAGGI